MKILHIIHSTRVVLEQSLDGIAPILKPRCRLPHQRFVVGMLAALGMFLSLGSTAQALEIISPPTSQTVCAPSPATFTVVAAGIPELLYQWSVSVDNGNSWDAIADGNDASYTIPITSPDQNGWQYKVELADDNGGGEYYQSDPVTLTVTAPATASAGANQTICANSSTAGLGGSVGGTGTGGLWSSSGTGSFVPNNTTLNAAYSPSAADNTAGTVTLTLSSTGQVAPCPPATAQVVVTIRTAASASTGGNQTICAGHSTAGLGGTVGGGATGGTWSSSGTGIFAPNATTLDATYTPSAADITTGTVTLSLTAQPCGDATAHLTLTINPAVATPTTIGGSRCGPGVVNLSATGSGGTLNWYSDSALTTLVNTGPAYGPAVSATTTYYVNETSGLECVSAASPVTATVYNGLTTVSAGPNQTVSSIATTIQLAGSVGNAAGSTWSGGSGTFSPNASTTNAAYTPSAAERAAGSWALTLTSSSPCGSASSTMNLTFMPELTLPVDTNTSTLQIDLCLQPYAAGIPFLPQNQCQRPISAIKGYMGVELDDPSHPTQITLQDFQLTAMSPYILSYSWTFPITLQASVTIGTLDQPASINDTYPGTGTTVPINPDGSFTLANVPLTSSGLAAYFYNLFGTNSGSGSTGLNAQTTVPTLLGMIHVTNEVATLHMEFSFATNLDITTNISGIDVRLVANGSVNGVVNAVGGTIGPRYMIWNNGAGTGNWNTSDLNWNNGSAKWEVRRGPTDCAIFGTTGIGTVNLSQPVTAAALYFQSPGYTITGNSLALANAGAVTNDADASIAGAIVSGTLNKWGPAMLTLSGVNTYSGGTFVNAGTLRISSDAALGAVPGMPATNVTLRGGQLLNNSSPSLAENRTILLDTGGGFIEAAGGQVFAINGEITGSGALGVVWDSGTVVLSGVNHYAGATIIGVTGNAYNNSPGANPILQLGSSTALPGADLIFGTNANHNAATLDLHGFNGTVAALTGGVNAIVDISGGGAGALTAGNNGASSTFSGVIRNTGGTASLTKIGNGILTLSGANTFTGTATASAGTLALSSSGSLAGPVSIGAGGTFDVTAVGGGTYRPPSGVAVMASGTTSAANLRGAPGGIVNLGSNPIILGYDGSDPALTISQGALSLSNNTITVNSPATLGEGTYLLIQVTEGTLVTNGTFKVNGTAIAHGYRARLSVSGGQLLVNVVQVSTPSTTTVGPFAPSQTYGSVSLAAAVSPADATGAVTFYDGSTPVGTGSLDGTSGTVVCTPVASLLPVGGSPHHISAAYEGDDNYAGSSSTTSSNLTITARAVALGGSKTYDKTKTVTPLQGLSLVNNVDGADLSLSPSSGSASLTGWNAGAEDIVSIITTNGPYYLTPARVQTASGDGGTWGYNATGSFTVNLATPHNGNTLVAAITTDGLNKPTITGVSQTGANWQRLAQAQNNGTVMGAETELWYAPNVSGAGTTVTITLAKITGLPQLTWIYQAAAVVTEYTNLMSSPLDVTSQANGNSGSFSTGSASTSQANEVWVGAVGIEAFSSSAATVSDLTGGWSAYNSASHNAALLGYGVYSTVYALESIVTSQGSASCSGSLSPSSPWAGVLATLKAASYYTFTTNLALAGAAAPNYTLTPSGTVTINKRPVTVTAVNATKTYDGTTTAPGAATVSGLASGDTCNPSSPGQSFSSRNAAAGNAAIIPATVTISDGNGGNNYSVIYSNWTTGVIAQTNLMMTAASNTKTYDGTVTAAAAPALSSGHIQPGDTAAVWTEAYDNRNVGTGKTLTPAGLVNDGNGGANYNYTYAQDFTGVIAQTNLAVTAVSNTKLYDGTTGAAAHPIISAGAIQPGDTAPVWTETYANKNAGTAKTLTPSALTVADGNGGLNYSYTYTPVTTGVIAQTNLTVTAATNTKFYDGTTNAAAHPTITVGSIQPGDTEPVWTETYTNQNAGTGKTLTPAELAVADGNGGANYNYTYAPDFSGVITALSTSTLLSSDSNPSGLATNVTFTATVSGVPPAADLPTGDVIFAANGTPFATNGLISGSITASTASLPAGTNTVTAQYVGDGNFEASLSSTLAQVVTNNVIYSQTNLVLSLVNNRNGTFTLNLRGTPGAQYYLAASGNVKAHMADWIPVAGTTNIIADSEGKWSCVVSNPAPAYYRPIAINPAP